MTETTQQEQEVWQLYISHGVQYYLPTMVKNELAKMSAQKQEEFIEEFKRKRKSVWICYLLYFFPFLQYGYIKKRGLQFLYWFTAWGMFMRAIADLFRIPGMIREYNKDVALEVMRNLKAVSAK